MILASLINCNYNRTDAMCENCAEAWIRDGYSIEQMFNSDTQACSECGRKEDGVNKLADITVTWLTDKEGQGKRGGFSQTHMPEEKVTLLHEQYKQLQHDAEIYCLEVHIKYHD